MAAPRVQNLNASQARTKTLQALQKDKEHQYNDVKANIEKNASSGKFYYEDDNCKLYKENINRLEKEGFVVKTAGSFCRIIWK